MTEKDKTINMTRETIARGLHTMVIGNKIIVLDVVSSTNNYAKRLSISDAPHGTVVIAEEQTAGRGRFDRRWVSARSMNILCSVLLRPESDHTARIPLVPFAASLAVADAICSVTRCTVECKWPNDLLISKKKVSGMLLESSMTNNNIEKLVLGIGVNVNQTDFPADIMPTPTSLRTESGACVDRIILLQRMLEALEKRYTQLMNEPSTALLLDWKSRTTLFGTHVTVNRIDSTLSGIAQDIAADGALLLRTGDGLVHTVRAGDVSLGKKRTL